MADVTARLGWLCWIVVAVEGVVLSIVAGATTLSCYTCEPSWAGVLLGFATMGAGAANAACIDEENSRG